MNNFCMEFWKIVLTFVPCHTYIIQLFSHYIAMWYAMPRSLVKLMEMEPVGEWLEPLDSDQIAE